MEYSVGEKVQARINKIQDNGCYCSLYHSLQYGFMPNNMMPSFFDDKGNFTKSVGDIVMVVIIKINDRCIILSDIKAFDMQERIKQFAETIEPGTIIEAEVIQVKKSIVKIRFGEIEGLIKKEDTNWNEIDQLEDLLFEGETINAVYTQYENYQLYFSLRLLNEKPYNDELYDLSLNDLLKYAGHDSNVFVGQAKQLGKYAFIENLYSCDEKNKGKLLIDPIYGYNLKAVVINQFNRQVVDGEYYKIRITDLVDRKKRIERSQLFQLAAEIIEETTNPYKDDVQLTFGKFTSPAGNVATAHLLAEVGKNMYSSKDRMFFELIQNADDAAPQKGVLVYVRALGDYLIVRHNGNSFDKDDFEAITSAANGTKKANENKTGYKGIGFKSVFTDSEKVYIKTGGYQFKFDKDDVRFTDFESFYFLVNRLQTEEAKQFFLQQFNSERARFKGVEDIPWQLEPIWLDSFPKELGEDFTKSNVAIALKLGSNKIVGDNGYGQAIANIISNPRFMLFLRNTKRIDFNGVSVSKTINNGIITLKNSFSDKRIEYFKKEDFAIEVSSEAFEESDIDVRIKIEEQDDISGKIIEAKFIDLHNQELENIPKKIAINNSTVISFAIPITENGELIPDKKCKDISMFAFLPTLVKDFKFPFYINANFILDPPRERILGDNPWNFYLMQQIAKCLVRWCAELNEKQDKNALNVLVPKYFDEDSTDTKQLAGHFNSAYKATLESESFILNHNGELAMQEEIIFDETGLSDIVGATLFCQLIETDKSLPSDKIDSKILKKDIFEEIETIEFEEVISAITNNDDFNEWFVDTADETKQLLYKWIKDNKDEDGLEEFVSNLPLFQFGDEYKSYEDTTNNVLFPNDYVITTEHILPIKDILTKIGFECSDNLFDENHPLYDFIEEQDGDDLFESIKNCGFSELDVAERKTLFFSLEDIVEDEEKLKEIPLFRNLNGDFKPLGEMVAYRDNVPEWFQPYVISEEDYCDDLSDYIIEQDEEFEDIIQEHYDDIDASFLELYNAYKDEWTGQFTRKIINEYDVDGEILSIIEDSDMQTKEHFFDSIKKLELSSTNTYPKDSYEYRILQLALEYYDEPSEFSSKIYYDEQCIKDISVSDEVICEYSQNEETKQVKMSLAKLLPQYQNQSDSLDKFNNIFDVSKSDKKDLGRFFNNRTSKSVEDVNKDLNKYLNIPEANFSEWNVAGNAYQYLFAVYYRREVKGWNNRFVPQIKLENQTNEFINDLLNFLCVGEISISKSPFTYHLTKYFENKYFESDFIFEYEQILPAVEKWADNDKKKKYLKDNGVRTNASFSIRFRQLFLDNKPIDFIEKLSDKDIETGIRFFARASKYVRPYVGENQKTLLLSIKDKCAELSDKWNIKWIKDNAYEWNVPEYEKWIDGHIPHIYIYSGKFPRQLYYYNFFLLNYDEPVIHYYYDEKAEQLFISDSWKIEDVLFEVAKEGNTSFDMDDYQILCREGKILVSKEDNDAKDRKIKDLENRIKDLERRLGLTIDDLPKEIIQLPTIKKGTTSTMGKDAQYAAQLEAQQRLMQEFPDWAYPDNYGECDGNGKPYNYTTVEVEDEAGNSIPIVLKSYKKTDEPFKINTEEWDYIIKEGADLLVYTGDDIKRIFVQDLIRNQHSIALSFSTENLDIEERIDAFSDALHYFKELHFDFDSFNISKKAQSVADIYKKNKRMVINNDNSEDDL